MNAYSVIMNLNYENANFRLLKIAFLDLIKRIFISANILYELSNLIS